MTVLGVSAAVWRAFRAVPKERVAAMVVLAAVLLTAGSWSGLTVIVVVDLVMLATLAVEHRRIEH